MNRFERIPGWLWLLTAILVARLLLMALLPLLDTSEPRYAEIARLMAESGDWITPWFEPGVPFWGKPPLAFWLSALSFKIFGYNDFSVRLPTYLATLMTIYLIFNFARSHFDSKVARLAALIYASSVLTFITAGAVLTDNYLTLAVTLSLVAFGKLVAGHGARWKYAFFFGLALGMLSKGPLAIVLVLAVVLGWGLLHRRLEACARVLMSASGVLMFLALTVPWYVLAELKTPGFLKYFIVGEHFSRFMDPGWQGDLYGTAHERAYGSIWLDWLLATFPWGLVAIWKLIRWKKEGARLLEALRESPRSHITFLTIWALVTPLFFTFSGNILWTYVQPSLPAFAVIMAIGLMHCRSSLAEYARWRVLLMAVPIAGVVAGALAMAYPQWLRTEKGLVQYYAENAQANQPLYYLNKLPFSARYYSRGKAGLYRGRRLAEGLDQNSAGFYLAIDNGEMSALNSLAAYPVLFKNRRYSLIFFKETLDNWSAPP